MGYRLHVCKTYQVEYSNYGRFSNCSEAINEIIAEVCPNAFFNGEDKCFSDEIQIEKEDLLEAIETIKNDTEYFDRMLKVKAVNYDSKELVDVLLDFIKYSDKKNSFVVLKWF